MQVGSQASGTIGELFADFNSRVTRGQVIARLEPSLFETQVEQAQATVLRLRADVERAQVQLDDARLKLTRARDLAGQPPPDNQLETAERFPNQSTVWPGCVPQPNPSDGRRSVTMRTRWSAGFRPGLPVMTTTSPGLSVSRVTPCPPS